MSRTSLCVLTAAVLALSSLGIMALRTQVLGDEVSRPIGPGSWKVTLAVRGQSEGNARLWTATPLDLERQQLMDVAYFSEQLTHKLPEPRQGDRRRVVWSQRGTSAPSEVQLRSEFVVTMTQTRSAGQSAAAPDSLYAAPASGEYLAAEPLIETSHESISEQARRLTAHLDSTASPLDLAQALYRFVEQKIRNEVRFEGSSSTSALQCLHRGSGDRCARSRLLVALLRNRNIPARVVSGVTLAKGPEQQGHYWVEAFVLDHWLPMCPTYKLFGRVPSTYLILGFGDRPVVTGKRIRDLKYTFLVERLGKDAPLESAEPPLRRLFKRLSLYQLPTTDRRLVEVLLLMPVAALMVCLFRNVIGLHSFGTFTPALIGLAFHDLNSMPGLVVFVSILLVGWLLRRLLDRYHLLQVPRIAMMLTLLMSVLIGLIVLSNHYGATTTRYISLFPIVILTGMVERFWTLENEDSTLASFQTLLQTMLMALAIALVLSRPWMVKHFFSYPETLGLVMAGQLLIGRYTGYRLMELFRFRDFVQPPTNYTTQAA